MAEILEIRESIAREILGFIDEAGHCRCPGANHHTHRNGRRDCRVRLDGAPTVYCVHASCAAVLDDVNYRLRSRIAYAERTIHRGSGQNTGFATSVCTPKTVRCPSIGAFDPAKLELLAKACRREVTLDWLAARSPVAVPSVGEQQRHGPECGRLFLDSLYNPGERVLIFTQFYSQGDFLAVSHGHSYRLGDKQGVKAEQSPLPAFSKEGIWFLTAPVSGHWKPMSGSEGKVGRRHEACATRFPYLLLESDKADASTWLKALVQLPLPIAALYTSGGRSIHALVKVECEEKSDFDSARDIMRAVLCPLGADGAAMTAIRLSRLPGGLRCGTASKDGYQAYEAPRLQRLVYLNPTPPGSTALVDLLK